MKKIFAYLTAFCCLSGGVSALTAFAEDFSEQEFYIVAQNVPPDFGAYYLHCYSEIMTSDFIPKYQTEYIYMNPEKAKQITGDKTSDYEYGDILLIDNHQQGYSSDDSYPPHYYLSDIEELHYAGNCKEFLETKTLMLIQKEEHPWDGTEIPESITFSFEDADKNVYQYLSYYYTNQPELDINACSVGDTVSFAVYNDTLILPLELHQTVSGDADGSGNLDILDVITVNKAILGKEDISFDRIPYIDFNGNGIPDSEDALIMMKMIVGLV